MKITIVTDHRFHLYQNNLYSSGRYDDYYFERFKGTNNIVSVIGLVDQNPDIKRLGAEIKKTDWLKFHLKKIDSNNKFWWFHKFIISHEQKLQLINSDERLIILPSFNIIWLSTILFKKSYSIYLIGDPYLSIKHLQFPLNFMSPIIYFKSKAFIKNSIRTIYVTKRNLQVKYPTEGNSLSLSDVDIKLPSTKIENIEKKGNIKIICVGNYDVKLKGHKYLLRAFKNANFDENMKLELIGGGSFDFLEKFIENNSIKNVILKGYMTHNDLINYLLFHKVILISSSLTEGLSRIIIEGLVSGAYVIASKVGGNSELVHSNYLYSPKDIKKLSKLINDAVYDIEMKKPYLYLENLRLGDYIYENLITKWKKTFSDE